MFWLVLFIIIALLLWLANRKSTNDVYKDEPQRRTGVNVNISMPEEEILIDEDGRKYKLVQRTIETPRKTYLSGEFIGKFRTKINPHLKDEFLYEKYYDIEIYEGEFVVNENGISKTPFQHTEEHSQLPPGFLPNPLYCRIPGNAKEFTIELHEPVINTSENVIDRALYQDDGDETFGTFKAQLSGYVLDFIKEEITEREYLPDPKQVIKQEVKTSERTLIPTGNIDYSGNYSRDEYWYNDRVRTYWGGWKYNPRLQRKSIDDEGCLDAFFTLIGIVIAAIFLLFILPHIGAIGLLFLIPLAIRLLDPVLRWVFQIIAALLLFLFAIGIFSGRGGNAPKPKLVTNHPEEVKKKESPFVDTSTGATDTIISHYRVWEDYDGNEYRGSIWVRKSEYANATGYKNNLETQLVDEMSYGRVVNSLRHRDSMSLNGVYSLFDSLTNTNHFDREAFSKVIVSFVQDIPYALILQGPCDRSYYKEDFIRSYLSSQDAICSGYQKFGINTPVEFMANLMGDCDTRTLLLFTILSHYGYDVVMLSSEVYAHSLLGINLPFEGPSYNYNGTRYILWETTAAGTPPGVISRDISNMNNWTITLKSN